MAGGVRTTTALALLRSRRLHPIIVRKGCHRLIAFAGHRLAAMKVMPVGVGVRLAAVVSATTVASPLGGATIGSRCPVSLDARRQVRGG